MKENMYQTTSELYTAAYALMMVFFILIVVCIALSLRLYRSVTQFKQEKKGFEDMQFQRRSVLKIGKENETTTNSRAASEQQMLGLEQPMVGSEQNMVGSDQSGKKIINDTIYADSFKDRNGSQFSKKSD